MNFVGEFIDLLGHAGFELSQVRARLNFNRLKLEFVELTSKVFKLDSFERSQV